MYFFFKESTGAMCCFVFFLFLFFNYLLECVFKIKVENFDLGFSLAFLSSSAMSVVM